MWNTSLSQQVQCSNREIEGLSRISRLRTSLRVCDARVARRATPVHCCAAVAVRQSVRRSKAAFDPAVLPPLEIVCSYYCFAADPYLPSSFRAASQCLPVHPLRCVILQHCCRPSARQIHSCFSTFCTACAATVPLTTYMTHVTHNSCAWRFES